MRRGVAFFLAACMMMQIPAGILPVHAADTGGMKLPLPERSYVQGAIATGSSADMAAGGTLRLKLNNLLGAADCSFRMVLEPSKKTAQKMGISENWSETLSTDWSESGQAVWDIEDIPDGTYQLYLEPMEEEAGAYLPYEQENLRIKGGTVTTLHLANDYPEYHGYESEAVKESRRMGVLMAGNFSVGDHEEETIDQEDLELLLDAVYSESGDLRFDLNGDQSVDLVDLEYFAKFYNNTDTRKAVAVQSPLVTEDGITVATDSNAVKQLFSGAAALTAAPDGDGIITEANPVIIGAEFAQAVSIRGFAIVPPTGSGAAMEAGEVIFTAEDGTEYRVQIANGEQTGKVVRSRTRIASQASSSDAEASDQKAATATAGDADGILVANLTAAAADVTDEQAIQGKSIVIDLGGQIPVKKVTIRITATVAGTNLAEISSVEFLNNMEDHIPEPELSIPDLLKGEPGDAEFAVTWRRQANVTGYDVWVGGETVSGYREQVFQGLEDHRIEITNIGGSEVDNNREYTVKVRSVNGDWRSPYSDPLTVIPEAAKAPEAPEQIRITGGYQKLTVSWKKMKSTDSYTLYYRETGTEEEAEFIGIENITDTQTEIKNLKDGVTYEIYMTGTNRIGTSVPSERYTGKTLLLKAPVTPNFMLINVPQEGGGASEVIVSVNNGNSDANLAQDDPAVVDGRYETSWVRKDWDAGFMYPADNKAPIITFDQAYTMDTVVIIPDYEQKYTYTDGRVYYWNEAGTKTAAAGTFSRRLDPDGSVYYEFQAAEPFTASKVQVTVTTRYGTYNRISYAELKFYAYHDLKERIYDLYTDNLHMTLKDEVTRESIEQLYADLEYTDPVSGEKTPKYDFLKQELDNAMTLLEQRDVNARVLKVDNRLTDKQDSHISFRGGLNTWQPLGVTGLAGDKVFLYVGAEGKNLGDATNLSLIATQYHSESSALSTVVGKLKVGPNEIVIPRIGNMSSAEAGGQLYIRYDGAYGAENYAVRVSVPAEGEESAGASWIPVLNLTGVADEAERASLIDAYLAELDSHDPEALHQKYHGDSGLPYDEKNCVFGATDLTGELAMLSLPAAEVLRGLSTADSRTQAVDDTMTAMDQMLTLFYQHKGLSDDPNAGTKNRMPVSRINIRYQRMFEGAFMYAGGAHIGIEWGSSAAMMRGVPVVSDENGKYISGSFYGWGIGHEIGHEINEGAYAVAEITNNYFAQLAQAKDTNEGMRFKYEDVFKKVTSGAKGPSSNGAVQLAMYWQLHLAYDRDYNYKTYDTYAEQFDRLFYARVDSYARNTAAAPAPGGVSLSLGSDTDNNLMRLACAAAEKNILEFFERWGMEPDAATRKYAEQFETETNAIWLASDDQRVAVMESDGPSDETNTITVNGSISYDQNEGSGNLVHVALESSSDTDFYGFEVFRREYDGDQVKRRAVGFVPAGEDSFTDVISTVNNRAFTYEVVGYDIWLRPTESAELGSVRVSHNGGLDSSQWTVTTNMVTVGESEDEELSDDNPDAVVKKTIERVIDQDNFTTYTGKTTAQQNANGTVTAAAEPEIVIYLNRPETVTGIEYRLSGTGTPAGAFEVYVSEDGTSWEKAEKAESSLSLQEENGVRVQRIVFSAPASGDAAEARELRSYTASMVKLTAPGQAGKEISVSEISLLGPTGDKVDLEASGIGLLAEDYKNPGTEEVLIPKGAFVVTGRYSGNPAYNTVLVWDENQSIVGGIVGDELAAEQIIFAPDPEEGDLTNISDGIWVYFIAPDAIPEELPKQLRAELYRVDNALTQEGQRLVSSTVYVEVPNELPEITLE